MELEFSESEIETLVELVYLGNWMTNATRVSDKRIVRYDELLDKILSHAKLITGSKLNREDLYDDIEPIIKQFETDIYPSLFAKKYADFLYLDGDDIDKSEFIKRRVSHRIFRNLCEKEIRMNKFQNIRILLPELEKEIQKALSKE